MKTGFLVISNIDMKDNQYIDIKIIKSLMNVFNNHVDIDQLGIIVNGNLSFSGKANEYKKIGFLFSSLYKGISNQLHNKSFIPFYITPGSHDNTNGEITTINSTSFDNSDEEQIEEIYGNEFAKFENFFGIANYNNCFKEDKFIDVKFNKNNFINTQINLINGEILSCVDDKKQKSNYFPEEKLNCINKRKFAKFVITVIPNNPENYYYNSIKKLSNKIYENSNIVICNSDRIDDKIRTKK